MWFWPVEEDEEFLRPVSGFWVGRAVDLWQNPLR
jgi:hypothetical protein